MNKIFSLVGLATRAGNTAAGEFTVLRAVRDNKASLVIVSEDASENTKKLFSDKCTYYDIPFYIYGGREELGSATGNKDRVSIAILDSGFSKKIVNMLTEIK